MKPGSFISKEDSKLLQGIAVCLMVFHHLFDFPDRIAVPYVSILNFSFINLEALLSSFGRICVALFAFTSGYGMRKGAGDLSKYRIVPTYKSMLTRIWSFAQRFWAVLLVFVGIGLAMGAYSFDFITLFKSIFGLSCAYNAEWWYIAEYIRFLAVFPLLMLGLKILERTRCANWIHGGIVLALMAATIVLPERFREVYIVCFICGIFLASVPVFEWLDQVFSKCKILYAILCLSILGCVFLARAVFLGSEYDFLYAPLFVFGFVGLMKQTWIRKVCGFILHLPGKYSTYIWLTHTFFGYYLFQKFTFLPKYSPLIFLWCMVLSTASGWILESALQLIHKGFQTLKKG